MILGNDCENADDMTSLEVGLIPDSDFTFPSK